MKNIFNTKKSLATALSRYGRVLSLIVVGLGLSAIVQAKTYYLDCSNFTTGLVVDFVQTQTSGNVSYSFNSTTGIVTITDFTFGTTDAQKLKFKLAWASGGICGVEQVSSNEMGSYNCIKVLKSGADNKSASDAISEGYIQITNYGTVNYTVTAASVSHGSLSPTSQTVASGGSTTFTAAPSTGYSLSAVSCTTGGTATFEGNTITVSNVTADCTVTPTFSVSATVPSIYIGQKPVVNGTSATINLQLSDWGCENVTAVKIYHESAGEPTTSSSDPWEFTLDPAKSSNTNFSVLKTNIPTGTYNIKAQAYNSVGWSTVLSDLATFTISGCDAPTLTAAYNATKSSTSISVDAGITTMGSCGLNAFGVEYSVNSDMSSSEKKAATVPTETGTQTVTITGLTPNTKYFYRTYAGLTSGGYAYSPQQYDFTNPVLTSSHSGATSSAVTINGTILAGGNYLTVADASSCKLQIATNADFTAGVQEETVGGAVGTEYSHQFTSLTPAQTYYYRMCAQFTDNGHTVTCYSETGSVTLLSVFTSVTIDATATVCAGSTVTPTKGSVPDADSWTFTSSDEDVATVDAKGVVTGVAAGSATITATAHKTGYADGSAQCAVTVNATPARPGDITGTVTELCASTNDYAFSITAVPGATGYTWSVASGDFTVSGDGINCTVNTGASYNGGTLQVVATNTCGSSTARTLALTKVADPTVSLSASAATVCSGSDVTITATVTNVSTFDWSTPTGWTKKDASKASATYTTAGTGAQTITYTGYNSCNASASANVSVTAIAIPTVSISVSDPACGTGNIKFSSSNVTPDGATVKWYDGSDTWLADAETYTFSGVAGGQTRTAKAKAVKDGCESAMTEPLTGSRKVNPVLTITVTSAAVTAGEANKTYGWEVATITATTGSGSTVTGGITQTTGTGGIISGNTVKGHVGDVFTGSYTATGTNGCTSSGSQTVTVIKAEETCPPK